MEFMLLDKEFRNVAVIDRFESLIWTDRYVEYGDFEFYTLADLDLINTIKQNYYIWSPNSQHMMIVEDQRIEMSPITGNHLTITGRSLESLLLRRIVWGQVLLNGNFQDKILDLIETQCGSKATAERKIPGLITKRSTDYRITSLKIDTQFTGDNLYDAVQKVCSEKNVGFKITLNDANQFVFELYIGQDRSYDQDANPWVVFSHNFENVIDSNYTKSNKNLRTVALIGGEGEGSDRVYITGSLTPDDLKLSGLDRRELFVDARDLSRNTEDGGTISLPEYYMKLDQRGREKLSENTIEQTFQGNIETNRMFKYNEDFFLGDIVQFESEYAFTSKVRVKEFIHSEGSEGVASYPTFEFIDEEV